MPEILYTVEVQGVKYAHRLKGKAMQFYDFLNCHFKGEEIKANFQHDPIELGAMIGLWSEADLWEVIAIEWKNGEVKYTVKKDEEIKEL